MTRASIWGMANQRSMIEHAIAHGIEPVAIGSPDREDARVLANHFGLDTCNDLRSMLAQDADVVWISAPRALDADTRSLLRHCDLPLATSAPPPAPLHELLAEPDGGMPAVFIPLLRGGSAWRGAAAALDDFGAVQCVHVSSTAGDHQTSIRSLLLDGVDLVVSLLGEPDEVWAAHAGDRPVSPEPAAELHGHIAASMRFGSDRAASVTVSDGGGTWIRRAVVLGEGGRLIVTDQGVSWTDPDGKAHDPPPAEGQSSAGALAAWHLHRLAQGRRSPLVPLEAAILLEAARLSCLTRQVEDPSRVRHMLESP